VTLAKDRHQKELKAAGWHSRGYLPHFDGLEMPQFISIHLGDSVPRDVIERWSRELDIKNSAKDKVLLQKRIEKYADQGYGEAFLKDPQLAEMVQETLMRDDGKKYRLIAWVVMPNHATFSLPDLKTIQFRTLCNASNPSLPTKRISFCGEVENSGCRIISIATFETRSTIKGLLSTLKTIR
jgi:hypothetical protein